MEELKRLGAASEPIVDLESGKKVVPIYLCGGQYNKHTDYLFCKQKKQLK